MKRSIIILLYVTTLAVISAHAFWNVQTAARVKDQRDPVCGLMVERNPELSAAHGNQTYYFCSREDARKFREAPEKYLPKK